MKNPTYSEEVCCQLGFGLKFSPLCHVVHLHFWLITAMGQFVLPSGMLSGARGIYLHAHEHHKSLHCNIHLPLINSFLWSLRAILHSFCYKPYLFTFIILYSIVFLDRWIYYLSGIFSCHHWQWNVIKVGKNSSNTPSHLSSSLSKRARKPF